LHTDKPKCFCGIIGVYGTSRASLNSYYGLHALQHRGQEASGIVSRNFNDKGKAHFNIHKGEGLVSEVFHNSELFESVLKGNAAIGHNRYSTTGSSESRKNIQPFVVNYRLGNLAVTHNGNLTNAKLLRDELVNEGAIFQTTSDSEVFLHLIARSRLDNQVDQVREALSKAEGAYCVIFLMDDKIIAARDPIGFRPLSIGKLNGGYVVASESCAFDINQADFIRDVEPGEIIVIDDEVIQSNNIKSYKIDENIHLKKQCIFEYIYFSRPDSRIFGHNVDKMRRKLGKILAKNHPVIDKDGDKVIVISVPDSSNTAAIGYENQLEKDGIPAKLEIGLIRSHYIGRTFIQPGQHKREIGVRIKFNTVKGVLENRTVVIVDDSIVRGTTSKQLINLIKEAGPKEIHLRISSPPIMHPCFYGMDFPSKEELIANKFKGEVKEIERYLEVDSLEYLTIEELLSAMVTEEPDYFCTACFSGKYPTIIDTNFIKEIYEN
jgi:amidophosphoribosyltransferase